MREMWKRRDEFELLLKRLIRVPHRRLFYCPMQAHKISKTCPITFILKLLIQQACPLSPGQTSKTGRPSSDSIAPLPLSFHAYVHIRRLVPRAFQGLVCSRKPKLLGDPLVSFLSCLSILAYLFFASPLPHHYTQPPPSS